MTVPLDRYRTPEQLAAMRQFIAGLVGVLETFRVPYFAQGGTLLGAVRDGDVIAWDYDVDICVTLDGYQQLLTAKVALANAGLELVDGSETGIIVVYQRDGLEYPRYQHILPEALKFNQNYLSQAGVRFPYCDINLVVKRQRSGDREPFYYYCFKNGDLDPKFLDWKLPVDSVESRTKTRLADVEIAIPGNSESYLKTTYGEDCLEHHSLSKWTDNHTLNPYLGFRQCWYLLEASHQLEGPERELLTREVVKCLEANLAAVPECIRQNAHLKSQLEKLQELMSQMHDNLAAYG